MKGTAVDSVSRKSALDLERLRRLGIWVPVLGFGLLLAVLEGFILDVYPTRPGRIVADLIAIVAVTAGASVFSNFIFRLVQQQEAEILRRNRDLAALNAVAAVANDSLDLGEILHRTLDKLLEVLKVDAGEIFLWSDESDALVQQAFKGVFPEAFRETTRFTLDEGFPGLVARTDHAIVVSDIGEGGEIGEQRKLTRKKVLDAGFRSFGGVPLKSKGKMLGVLNIASLTPDRLTRADTDLLSALGYQVGIAIENARLYERVKEMTMLEERQRIAREMHDGLAQQLGYLSLKLAELESTPSLQPVRGDIAQLRKLAAEAYEDGRQAIFGLKTMVSHRLGLVPTLTEFLHDFSEQSGIAVSFSVEDERATRLPAQAEVQLIRIVQEALTNVRKHAHARAASVVFRSDGDGHAEITIQDNGRGFDLGKMAAVRGSFGLQTMRERAELAAGTINVISQPGHGTQVVVRLPLHA